MHTRMIRALAAFTLATAALTACTADPEPGSGSGAPSTAAAPGGTFTLALDAYPNRGLNPHFGAAFDASQVLRNAYDSLVSMDSQEKFHPWLAKSWTISPDGKTYEFTLRDDVKFTNGEKLDAQAVKANIDAVRNPDSPDYPFLGELCYSSVSAVDVLDPYKVRIALDTPRADFLSTLSGIGGGIVAPSTLVADKGTLTSGEGFVGSGPFIIDKVVAGQEIDFRKNPDYNWGPESAQHQGAAFVDRLVVKYIPDGSTRAGLLRNGEVDAIGTVKATDIDLFKGVSGFQYAQTGSDASNTLLYLNLTNGPTTDKRVRQALTLGVDLDAVVQNVTKGTQDRAWSLISPDSKYFEEKYDGSYPVDIDKAKSLLEQAGWKGTDGDGYRTDASGKRLVIHLLATTPTYPQDDFLKAWQAELRQNLGVQVELQYVENAQVYGLLAQNGYEAFPRQVGGLDLSLQLNRGFGSTTPDLKYGRKEGITLGSIVAGAKLADPQVDRWLLDATKATDDTARKQIFDQITGYVLENAIAIPLYTDRNSVASNGKVHNLTSLFDAPRNVVNGWAYDIAVEDKQS